MFGIQKGDQQQIHVFVAMPHQIQDTRSIKEETVVSTLPTQTNALFKGKSLKFAIDFCIKV